jgi:hypothetical protein
MNEANTNIKFAQPMSEYVPGVRDDEKTALDAMAKAKAEFERLKGEYDERASRHKFHVDEAALRSDESRSVNFKIRDNLRKPSEFSHKENITLRAEMREALEMMENHLFLANECSESVAEAKVRAEQAANQYRFSRAVALELVADNMLDAAIGAANNLFVAMYTKVAAFRERRTWEKTWAHMGFESEEKAVFADVNARIAKLYRALDDHYMRQMLPAPLGAPIDLGDLGKGTPASWHMERAGVRPKPEASLA